MGSYAAAVQVYAAGLVFARIGAMVMLTPGLGDTVVPPRARLSFALLMSLILTPLVAAGITSVPPTVGEMAGRLIHELIIGLMIGTILRVFLAALSTAGEVISIQSTLSFAQTVDPAQGQNASTVASFLTLLGGVLIMTTDLHHLFLGAMARSYELFPFEAPVPLNDGAALMIRTVGQAFALGIQLAAPIIVFSLIINIATGLVARVMPQFQVFFVVSPLSMLLGLSLLAMGLGIIGVVWTDRFRELLSAFG